MKMKEEPQMYQPIITNQEIFTEQWTKTFSQVYPTYEAFAADYETIGLNAITFKNKDAMLKHIYLILMGEYANSAIANLSEDQFKVRLFTTIMSYGPQYERELAIQNEITKMEGDDLLLSSKAISNSANNPSQSPKTDSLTALSYISE